MAELHLIQKTYDDLRKTYQRIVQTIREHDSQLERDAREVAYWEARREEIQGAVAQINPCS